MENEIQLLVHVERVLRDQAQHNNSEYLEACANAVWTARYRMQLRTLNILADILDPEGAGNNQQPGQLWYDREGRVSHSTETTYVLLSADKIDNGHTKWEWIAAGFHSCDCGWMGAPIKKLWDGDFEHLHLLGELPKKHLIGHDPKFTFHPGGPTLQDVTRRMLDLP